VIIFRKRVAGLTEPALARFVARAARSVKLHGSINVLVTSNGEMKNLNRRFRAKDQPTDVLSFPAGDVPLSGLAGDVAISLEIAAKHANQFGHSPAEEIKILALHGVLHLAGYDHETDDGNMARKEERLRKLLGLPSGLTERNGIAASPRKRIKL
jgi:probable rRNA maturation factor